MISIDTTDFINSGALLQGPNQKIWVAVGPFRRQSVVSGEFAFYAPDFFLRDKKPYWVPSKVVECSLAEFRTWITESGLVGAAPSGWQAPEISEFAPRFSELQSLFAAGALKKAVPVVFERASNVEAASMLQQILNTLASTDVRGYRYGLWSEGEGMIGVTPEVLLQQQGSLFKTMALAGTRSKKSDLSLLDDPKQVHEHHLVIDDICQALADLAKPVVSDVYEFDVGAMYHLRADIEWKADGSRYDQVVSKLHPTAALGASPRPFGWEWLQAQPESNLRWRYGAPFGVVGNGVGFTLVAIRNVQFQGSNVLLGSGCGIVPQSQLETEWREFHLKRQSVMAMLGLSSNRVSFAHGSSLQATSL